MTTSPQERSRLGYATDVLGRLWPGREVRPRRAFDVRRSQDGGGPRTVLFAFPGLSRPRLLVPADVKASATMVGRLGKGRTPWSRAARNAAATAVRSPLFAPPVWASLELSGCPDGEESVESRLSDVLGRPVRVGIMLGTPRANQKPVLQLFGEDGSVVGFAKVGHNDLTAALVRHEAQALDAVGRSAPTRFTPPRLLHHGRWHGLELCVMSALSGEAGLRIPAEVRVAAMIELARFRGTTTGDLRDSEYLDSLRTRLAAVTTDELRDRLLAAVDRVEAAWGGSPIELGAWHGDWGHWNMALRDGTVQLWDWERFDAPVPLGFDGVHFRAQAVRPYAPDRDDQERAFLEAVPAELGRFGVPAPQHEVTLVLYLLEAGVRYATDLNHPSGGHVRRRLDWALALLDRRLAAVCSPSSVEGP